MIFDNVPKFVVNLERRPDRLESIKKEMDYIGWDFELFKGIDRNTHEGITLSILSILEIAKERNYPRVMIIEDDIQFMPYSKDLLTKLESSCEGLEFGIFSMCPTLDRPINRAKDNELLLDMTNLPEKLPNQRDIYAMNMIVYDSSVYELFQGVQYYPRPFYHAIDEYMFLNIINKHQSYCPILPIAPQGFGESNISPGIYNNFYLQTYNWNLYSPCKIPGEFTNQNELVNIKNNKIHKDFYYVS